MCDVLDAIEKRGYDYDYLDNDYSVSEFYVKPIIRLSSKTKIDLVDNEFDYDTTTYNGSFNDNSSIATFNVNLDGDESVALIEGDHELPLQMCWKSQKYEPGRFSRPEARQKRRNS